MPKTSTTKIALAVLFGFFLSLLYNHISEPIMTQKTVLDRDTSVNISVVIMTFNTHETTYDVLSLTNKSLYAKKHGYSTYFVFPGQHAGFWYKLNVIEDAIKLNKYDWLWWIDYDTLITNSSIALTDIIDNALRDHPNPSNIDLIFTPDCWPLNNGAMLIRSSPEIFEWLALLLACGRRSPDLTEQDCMRDVLGLNKDVENHPERSAKWAKKLIMIPQRAMNSFPEEIKCHEKASADGVRPGGPWQPGDFVIHFAGSWAHLPQMENPAGYLMNKYKGYVDLSS